MKSLARIFFLETDEETARAPAWAVLFSAFFIFFLTRFLVLAAYDLRGFHHLTSDPGNYIQIAEFIARHGHIPNQGGFELRQFPGLSMLMAPLGMVLGDMVASGYAVSYFFSLASIALFHFFFRSARLTFIYTIFVPSWLASSTLIMSEGLTFFLIFCAMFAVSRDGFGARQIILLTVAGYVFVVRNTALFFIIPFIVFYGLWKKDALSKIAFQLISLAVLPVIYLLWNQMEIGEMFPQKRFQLEYFILQGGDIYPKQLVTWPCYSMAIGLCQPAVPLAKKASVLASLALAVAVPVLLVFRANTCSELRAKAFHLACAAGAFGHLIFHLCIGGAFGFNSFDRYVSHINPVLVYALFGEKKLRWQWIVLIAVVGVVFASLTGRGERALFSFLKPE